MSITRRAIPDASSLDEAIEVVRGNWLRVIEKHHQQYSRNSTVGNILDIGCSIGWSTRFLADKYPSANVTVSSGSYFLSEMLFRHVILVLRWLGNVLTAGIRLVTLFFGCCSIQRKE